MDKSYSRFRWRHRARKLDRGYKKAIAATHDFLTKYVFRRTPHLKAVQRFVLIWLLVVGIAAVGLWRQFQALPKYYVVAGPKAGGSVVEGVVGGITNINPIFQEGDVNDIAASLIFSGLVRYSKTGEVQPDLADSWKIDESGKVYTFKLHPGVTWQDGEPFSSSDVVFTIKTIQNPSVLSPLEPNWRGIEITAPDANTVVFKLPNPYAPFIYSLSTGILPEHLLNQVEPASLRKAEFNQSPVGTGPFHFKEIGIARDEIRMLANEQFYLGKPKLNGYVLKTYKDYDQLRQAFAGSQINFATNFPTNEYDNIKRSGVKKWLQTLPLDNEALAFFNTKRGVLGEKSVRQALSQSVNINLLLAQYGGAVRGVDGPLLPGQLGYVAGKPTYNPKQAASLLDQAGWVVGPGGVRQKDGQPLKLGLVTQDSDVYPDVAQFLRDQWRQLGIQTDIKLASLQELKQSYVRPRNYDVLLTQINLGVDPDVYSFWHSSQVKDPGLNLSQYGSARADEALVSGRTRMQKALRAAKYEQFQQQWREDAPGIALFRPNFVYLNEKVLGIEVQNLPLPAALYYNSFEWTARTQEVLAREHPELVIQQNY